MERMEYIKKSYGDSEYNFNLSCIEWNGTEFQYWIKDFRFIKAKDLNILIDKIYFYLKRLNKKGGN